MQALGDRIVFPSAFNRSYRCVLKYIKSYVMEELANLIFIGSYIAQCGPPGFKSLWMLLQPALWHYLYGYDDTVAQQHEAAKAMRSYAVKLEELVAAGVVRPATVLRLACALKPQIVVFSITFGREHVHRATVTSPFTVSLRVKHAGPRSFALTQPPLCCLPPATAGGEAGECCT